MDPTDRPFDLVDGAACAACGRSVPPERVNVLARREDLAFVELPCEGCGSVSLAMFVSPSDEPGSTPPRPIGPDDVLDMHVFLAGWSGDLRGLVADADRPRPPDAA